MSGFINNLSPKEWEDFCEVMLRQHFGAKNFYPVPDQDGGDFGLEFFTVEGTLFQCYYPEQGIGMNIYKKRIQKKINDDLKKLKENEKEKIAKAISYLDVEKFSVKIETADSYPAGKLYAQGVYSNAIDIPLRLVTEIDKSTWKTGNSKFSNNYKKVYKVNGQ